MSDEKTPVAGDITEAKDGGIIKEILVESTSDEKPQKGDTVLVHYVGRLTDGTEFDSSIGRKEPFSFKLGKGQVIKGWDIGVATMKVGEKCRLTVKPEYGYGSDGAGEKIPANATLIFEVELLSIKGEDISEDRDGSVTKRVLKEGEGYMHPSDGSTVVVTEMEGYALLDNDKREPIKPQERLEWVIGEADDLDIPEGLECAIMRMKKGERAKVEIMKSRFEGSKTLPKHAKSAVYTLTLDSFEKAKESWQMDEAEKLEAAKVEKEKGTKYFKAGNYKQAIKRYKRVSDFVRVDSMSDEPAKAEQRELTIQANNNLAICYLKQKDYHKAIECADKVLEKDSKNEKALFRRGEARLVTGDWTEALEDFGRVLEINASNSAAAAKIREVKERMRAYREQEKNIFSKMMKGISSRDSTEEKKKDVKEAEASSQKNASKESGECCKQKGNKDCCKEKGGQDCSKESSDHSKLIGDAPCCAAEGKQ